MVLAIVDESRPKCYLCHEGVQDIDALRKHIQTMHEETIISPNREPAPGDVTVF